MNILHALYLFIFSLLLAFFEVQIEGKDGWAARLPTWRPQRGWYARFYKKMMGGKELTGYHIGVFGLVFLFLHYPFFAGGILWSVEEELWVISTFLLVSVVWDYLWIIINPHYGVIRRRPRHDVSWHRVWWGPFPRDYYFGVLFSALVLYPLWSVQVCREWGILLGVLAAGTLVTLLVTESVRGDVQR